MKIERISDNQIKIIVDSNDLADRNIKFSDLSFGNPDTIRGLFKDMMEQAIQACDFRAETDSMFFVEVVPMSAESIMLLITKTAENMQESINRFMGLGVTPNFTPRAKTERRFKQKPFIEPSEFRTGDSDVRVFSFKSLDDTALACRSINGLFSGLSSIYKLKNKYYLLLAFDKSRSAKNVLLLLNEFGQHAASSSMSTSYLNEHGELLISEGAVGVAAAYLC